MYIYIYMNNIQMYVYIFIPYITLHSIPFHYITLHYINYITLHYITLHYITLHYITLHYITLHYITYIYACIHVYIYETSVNTLDPACFNLGNRVNWQALLKPSTFEVCPVWWHPPSITQMLQVLALFWLVLPLINMLKSWIGWRCINSNLLWFCGCLMILVEFGGSMWILWGIHSFPPLPRSRQLVAATCSCACASSSECSCSSMRAVLSCVRRTWRENDGSRSWMIMVDSSFN